MTSCSWFRITQFLEPVDIHNLFLSGLNTQTTKPQVHTTLECKTRTITYIYNRLPDELWRMIFSWISIKDIVHCVIANPLFNRLIGNHVHLHDLFTRWNWDWSRISQINLHASGYASKKHENSSIILYNLRLILKY